MIIAGTGHRPKYLPCGYNDPHPWLDALKGRIKSSYEEHEPRMIISGSALGFDQWIAEVAIEMGIDFELYLPYPEQGDNWPTESQAKLQNLKAKARNIIICSSTYTKDCFFKRDYAMVENSDVLLALWDTSISRGGTYKTKQYAISKNKSFENLFQE